MKLSSIIAKEIRMKHLNEGIMHTQTRNKYRNYKLKEHYQTPKPSHNRLYLYSNLHGNQFIFKQEHFHAANFPDPAEAYFQIVELQKESTQINMKSISQSMTCGCRERHTPRRSISPIIGSC
jgi:hypothetical protein